MSTAVYQSITTMNVSTVLPVMEEILSRNMFNWFDYLLFGGSLTVSVIIGIYFGFFSKQDTTEDYILGGKKMSVIPIAMSLVASEVSGIALLGTPADVYLYGGRYILQCGSAVLASIAACYITLPIFCNLQVSSAYEYLQIRFDKRVRVFASILFIISAFLYMPVVIHAPALAFAQASGIDENLIIFVVCLICIFYTAIGGLKAVVWTDTIQMVSIVASTTIVFILGITSAGGFTNVWKTSVEGDRLNLFDFYPDFTIRDNVWCFLFGSTTGWFYKLAVYQVYVQRILSLPNSKDVAKTYAMYVVGTNFLTATSVFTGLIMYTIYFGCDPVTTGEVEQPDQLIPYYIIQVADKLPGLPGIYMAGIFSAGLSTLSTSLNTVSGTIYQDIIRSIQSTKSTEKHASNVMKIIVIVSGIIATLMVFVVQRMGTVSQLCTSLGGVTCGPLLGMFLLGMLFPIANKKGGLYGGISGLVFMAWLVFGNEYYIAIGRFGYPRKPVSVEECSYFVNITANVAETATLETSQEEPIFVMYRISFYYYALIGTCLTIMVGLVVSWFTCKDDPPVHRDLISPVVKFFLTKEENPYPLQPTYLTVEKALDAIKDNSSKEQENNTTNT